MECCYVNKENLSKCARFVSKQSFFCSKHKPQLFKTNEFTLAHGGNRVKIIEDMEIKTAKSLGIRGIGGFTHKKSAFDQVFFQFFFPGHSLENSQSYSTANPKLNKLIKKEYIGTIEVNIKILQELAKMGKEIHFVNNFAFGGCNGDYCIQWNPDYSIRENLNRIYHFILADRFQDAIQHWKYAKDKKISFMELRASVLDMDSEDSDYVNELVISGNVPLLIRKKNYVVNDKVEEN